MSQTDAAWTAFLDAGRAAEDRSIQGLFDDDRRLDRLTLEAAGLYLDLSKQPWSLSDLDLALDLAKASGVETARAALLGGEPINTTEGRAVQHAALRAPKGSDFKAAGVPISAEVDATRASIRAFAEQVRSGLRKGASGLPFRAIVHIGIGGSDLGPRVVWEALKPLAPEIELRFVANVDPAELAQALTGLNPEETLVVTVSKTFTTQETLANAAVAKAWLQAALGDHAGAHLAAVSAAPDRAAAFGVPGDQVFAFRDWVGGRYSLWSAVGLSCAIALGPDAFEGLLDGAHAMDRHFAEAPLAANAPVLLALAHAFNRNGLSRPIRAVVPYAQRLSLFPAFLQQLEMESNGKRVTLDGDPVPHRTAASVFGDAGTNGQHAFFQLLHQGTDVIPVDFVAVKQASEGDPAAQRKLLANVIAQAEALLVGRPDAPEPHRVFPGNRPSSFILMDRLTPQTLGALLALYEHKTFVEGVLWRINSFDQFGVELGKALANEVLKDLEGGDGAHDPSTTNLIARLR